MLTFSKTLPYYQLTVVDGFVRLVPRKRITINNNKRDQEIEQKWNCEFSKINRHPDASVYKYRLNVIWMETYLRRKKGEE